MVGLVEIREFEAKKMNGVVMGGGSWKCVRFEENCISTRYDSWREIVQACTVSRMGRIWILKFPEIDPSSDALRGAMSGANSVTSIRGARVELKGGPDDLGPAPTGQQTQQTSIISPEKDGTPNFSSNTPEYHQLLYYITLGYKITWWTVQCDLLGQQLSLPISSQKLYSLFQHGSWHQIYFFLDPLFQMIEISYWYSIYSLFEVPPEEVVADRQVWRIRCPIQSFFWVQSYDYLQNVRGVDQIPCECYESWLHPAWNTSLRSHPIPQLL